MEILRRAKEQAPDSKGVRNSRWLVIRRTYPELQKTTLKSWSHLFPENPFGKYNWNEPITHNWSFRLPDKTSVKAEIIFMALDGPRAEENIHGAELTGGWVNECKEVAKPIIDVLRGRVGRYPAMRDGGPTWYGVIMDTNPPDDDHWLYKLAEKEKPEGWGIYKQPGGVIKDRETDKWVFNPNAENLQNLPPTYYTDQMAGQTEDYIKVNLAGEYGYVREGKPVFPEYSDTLHVGEFDPVPNIGLHLGADWGLCYDDQTEVLTEAGWKFFKDVDAVSDKAATRNPETGALEYTPINFKVDRPYKGKMLQWANSTINFCVTPEHRVPFSYRETPDKVHFKEAQWLADNMTGHHYVDLCAKWNKSADCGDYGPLNWPAELFAEFMGIYLSEGCCEKGSPAYRVTISQKDQCPKIQAVLDKTGLNWVWKGREWVASCRPLAEYLQQFGYAHDKHVPLSIRSMSSGNILRFIDMYTHGDGHIRTRSNGSVEHTIYTVSSRMAADMQELALKVGWHSSANWEEPQTSVIAENGVEREITNTGGYRVCFKKRATRGELLKEAYSEIDYDGRIYCLNVPYHTLFVRRGGKVHWNGNTPAGLIAQRTASGQILIHQEIVCDGIGAVRFAEQIKRELAENFPGFPITGLWGDPAGAQKAQTDESTVFAIMKAAGLPFRPAPGQKISLRLEAVRAPLTRLVDGKPGVLIHRRCTMLRAALSGKYCYKRIQVTAERYMDKPDKNEYSHVADAMTYLALGMGEGKALMRGSDSEAMRPGVWVNNRKPRVLRARG
jgi:hypothetical protein